MFFSFVLCFDSNDHDSVAINVSELLELKENPPPEPELEPEPMKEDTEPSKAKAPKRKSEPSSSAPNKKSKPSTSASVPPSTSLSVTLKIPPQEILDLPCCLCVGSGTDDLLPVHDAPAANIAAGTRPGKEGWKAHRRCAKIVPETWVDEDEQGQECIYGVDAIVRDRWNLVSFWSFHSTRSGEY